MAIRADAVNDALIRTANVPDYNAPYTVAVRLRITGAITVDSDHTVFSINNNAATNYDRHTVIRQAGVVSIASAIIDTGAGQSMFWGTAPASDTWFGLAFKRISDTQMACFVNGVQLGTTWTHTTMASRSPSPTRFEFFGFGSPASTTVQAKQLRIQWIKQWSDALTDAEIAAESRVGRVVRKTNNEGFWPCFPGATLRLLDFSGKGRDFTAGGILADEAADGLGWGATVMPVGRVNTTPAFTAKGRRTLHATGTRVGSRRTAA